MLNFDWTGIIGLIAVGQAMALLFYLGGKLRVQSTLLIPFSLFAVLALALIHDILLHTRLALYFPHILGLGPMHTYLIGPIVLLLTVKLIRANSPLSRWHLLHFIPFIVQFYNRSSHLLQGTENKLNIIENYIANPVIFSRLEFSLHNFTQMTTFHGHRFIYFGYAIFLLSRCKKELQYAVGSRAYFTLLLKKTLIIYCILWGILRILLFVPIAAELAFSFSNTFNSIGLSLMVIAVANFCFNCSIVDIFSTKNLRKYQKTGVDEKLIPSILKELIEYLSKKDVFTDPDLKASEVASTTGFTQHQISQAISLSEYSSFNFILNHFRAEEFKRLLAQHSDDKVDMLQLAFQAGFNSKATFNRAFKQQNGITPREYRLKYVSPTNEL